MRFLIRGREWKGPSRQNRGGGASGSTYRSGILVAFLLGACAPKDGGYFGPLEVNGGPASRDKTPPLIYDLLPATTFPLNSSHIRWSARDPNSVQYASGINSSMMSARTLSGLSLPIRPGRAAETYQADIDTLPEGPHTITIVVADSAGLQSDTTISFIKDRLPPTVIVNVPDSGSTTQPSATISIWGQFHDPNGISAATMRVLRAQQDGTCSSTGTLFDQGSVPGTVGQNTYDLRSSLNGQFNLALQLNGLLNEQRPGTTTVCAVFDFADNALNKFAEERPSRITIEERIEYRWQRPPIGSLRGRVTVNGNVGLAGITVSLGPHTTTTTDLNGDYRFDAVPDGLHTVSLTGGIPLGVQCNPSSQPTAVINAQTTVVDFDCTQFDYTLSVEVVWRHVAPGVSVACARLRVTPVVLPSGASVALPSLAGATWTASWTGPGVVGSTQRSGTFDANNEAIDRQQINLFGTYTVNVSSTASGVTKQVSGSVTVNNTQGTCPP